MSGKSVSSTTTVKRLPPYAVPYAQSYLARTEALSLVAYSSYSGATIAPQPTNEVTALAAMAARGTAGDPVMNEAVVLMEIILNGSFLLGTRQAFIDMWSDVQSAISSEIDTFVGLLNEDTLYAAGAPVAENKVSDELSGYKTTVLSRFEKKIYRENYNVERGLQSVAAGSAVSIGGHEIMDAELLRMAGLHQREYDQAVIHDAYRQWQELQEGEIKRLDILGNGIRALVGTQSAITKPYYRPSKAVSTAGGALSGAAIGYQTTGTWQGAAVGGVIGAVLGSASSQ